jgi:hypothetical protein
VQHLVPDARTAAKLGLMRFRPFPPASPELNVWSVATDRWADVHAIADEKRDPAPKLGQAGCCNERPDPAAANFRRPRRRPPPVLQRGSSFRSSTATGAQPGVSRGGSAVAATEGDESPNRCCPPVDPELHRHARRAARQNEAEGEACVLPHRSGIAPRARVLRAGLEADRGHETVAMLKRSQRGRPRSDREYGLRSGGEDDRRLDVVAPLLAGIRFDPRPNRRPDDQRPDSRAGGGRRSRGSRRVAPGSAMAQLSDGRFRDRRGCCHSPAERTRDGR